MRYENPGKNALRGAPADSLFADRERLPDRRMRLSVRLGDNADALDSALCIHLAWGAIFRRPILRHWPPTNTHIIRSRRFVVFALETDGLLGPRHLHDLKNFLEHCAVVRVDFGAIHRCASHVIMLAEHIRPAILVAASESG